MDTPLPKYTLASEPPMTRDQFIEFAAGFVDPSKLQVFWSEGVAGAEQIALVQDFRDPASFARPIALTTVQTLVDLDVLFERPGVTLRVRRWLLVRAVSV